VHRIKYKRSLDSLRTPLPDTSAGTGAASMMTTSNAAKGKSIDRNHEVECNGQESSE
jgi:hypothetical protein